MLRHSHQAAFSALSAQLPHTSIQEPLSSTAYSLYPLLSKYFASIPLVVHTFIWSTLAGINNELYRQAFYNAVDIATDGRR